MFRQGYAYTGGHRSKTFNVYRCDVFFHYEYIYNLFSDVSEGIFCAVFYNVSAGFRRNKPAVFYKHGTLNRRTVIVIYVSLYAAYQVWIVSGRTEQFKRLPAFNIKIAVGTFSVDRYRRSDRIGISARNKSFAAFSPDLLDFKRGFIGIAIVRRYRNEYLTRRKAVENRAAYIFVIKLIYKVSFFTVACRSGNVNVAFFVIYTPLDVFFTGKVRNGLTEIAVINAVALTVDINFGLTEFCRTIVIKAKLALYTCTRTGINAFSVYSGNKDNAGNISSRIVTIGKFYLYKSGFIIFSDYGSIVSCVDMRLFCINGSRKHSDYIRN